MSKILTGDRPTGQLHLGHYVGSLKNRVMLQHQHEQTILVADSQALTDNMGNPQKIKDNVIEVVKDYIASGIEPEKTTICLQSKLPAIAELTLMYLNLVTVSRLERNPTISNEIKARNFGRDIPAGFLIYPVAQAADITAFNAQLVPVGEDQLPLIEQANEVVKKLNNQIGFNLLHDIKPLLSNVPRLPSLDGQSKMSKSSGNTITLTSSFKDIQKSVNMMFTDPTHIKVSDPGRVEGNVVFSFLDAFDEDIDELSNLKAFYIKGGLGDSVLKKRLIDILENVISPIREKREYLNNHQDYIWEILKKGTEKAKQETQFNVDIIRRSFGYFDF